MSLISSFNSSLLNLDFVQAKKLGDAILEGEHGEFPESLKSWIRLKLKTIPSTSESNGQSVVRVNNVVYSHHPDFHLIKEGKLQAIPVETAQDIAVDYQENHTTKSIIKTIAFYLPQFHPFPENDQWWGKGFTEWTNVGKALPRYEGHYQPHCPIHLGYYDLRIYNNMKEQFKLAKNYGIDGFSYYFYWFAGKTLMEDPLINMLQDDTSDFEFCLTWANENWTRRWDGAEHDVLIGQKHSEADSINFFNYILKYLHDRRYIQHNGKPVLIVYRADIIPEIESTTKLWRKLAKEHGFDDLYLIAAQTFGITDPTSLGFDAAVEFPPHAVGSPDIAHELNNAEGKGHIYDYNVVVDNKFLEKRSFSYKKHFTCMLGWDNTARKGLNSHIFARFSLAKYQLWLSNNTQKTFDQLKNNTDYAPLTFINAWNEWAEGTHLEPDQKYKFAYLDATHRILSKYHLNDNSFLELIANEHDPRLNKHNKKDAIIIHCFYPDVLKEIFKLLASQLTNYDVYITTDTLGKALTIKEQYSKIIVDIVPNYGRDIQPFIKIYKSICEAGLSYEKILKIHTKKSVYRNDGRQIGSKLLQSLCDKKAIKDVEHIFESEPTVGMICTKDSLISHKSNENWRLKYNMNYIDFISSNIGLKFKETYFPAGSMFWFRHFALAQLSGIYYPPIPEIGLNDGTYAHAIERLFCNLVEHNGFKIEVLP